jgi:hypothetical protein
MTVEHEIKELIKKYADDLFQSWVGKVNKRLEIIEDRLRDVDTFNAKDREDWVKVKEEVNRFMRDDKGEPDDLHNC